jgi:purine-binding chemotaxis protein CheW
MSTNALAVTPAPAAPAVGSGQYLTFRLGPEEYGIEILKVQEIKGFTAVTPIPNTPPYVKGVLNLRGTVVPVLDLRTKFGMPETPYDKFTVIVVVTVGARVLGMVVDSVSDVLDIAPGAIEAIPDLGAGIDTTCLSGMAKSGDKLVLLLDLARVVTFDALPAGT